MSNGDRERRAREAAEAFIALDRCAVCRWPLKSDPKDGCIRGNCSYRPEASDGMGRERLREARRDIDRLTAAMLAFSDGEAVRGPLRYAGAMPDPSASATAGEPAPTFEQLVERAGPLQSTALASAGNSPPAAGRRAEFFRMIEEAGDLPSGAMATSGLTEARTGQSDLEAFRDASWSGFVTALIAMAIATVIWAFRGDK